MTPSPRVQYDVASNRPQQANLADILERVLDKGIVIAGDIKVNLLDIELLTIKVRLLVASADTPPRLGYTGARRVGRGLGGLLVAAATAPWK